MLIAAMSVAQSDTRQSATQPSAIGKVQTETILLTYHEAIQKEVAAYRSTVSDLRAKRDDAVARAEGALRRSVETANSAYRSGTTRAFDLLEQTRKSRAATAIQSYDRDIKASTTSGELAKAAALTAAKEQFIAIALDEGARLQSEAQAVVGVVEPAHRIGSAVILHVRAAIDGSDELLINHESATWRHKTWTMPTVVEINGIKWNPATAPVLRNSGNTVFLASVDFSKAIVKSRAGRDTVACEISPDGLRIVFADADNGGDTYDMTIEFPAE
jgi:hypothetical protein